MYMRNDAEYSIKCSKMLAEYKKIYPYSGQFQEEQLKFIYRVKNIDDDKARFYVGKVVRELHSTLYAGIYFEALKKQPYSSTNE